MVAETCECIKKQNCRVNLLVHELHFNKAFLKKYRQKLKAGVYVSYENRRYRNATLFDHFH